MDPSNLSERELLFLILRDLGNLSSRVESLQQEQSRLRTEFHQAELKAAQATVSKQAFETLQTEVSRLSLRIATTEVESKTKLAILGSGISIFVSVLTTIIIKLMAK
jgi:uncharacterized protein YlxW (UPF0749 family)